MGLRRARPSFGTWCSGKIFRSELAKAGLGHVRLWEYCDDLVVAAPNASDMQAAFAVLDRVADELGVDWKKSKDESEW